MCSFEGSFQLLCTFLLLSINLYKKIPRKIRLKIIENGKNILCWLSDMTIGLLAKLPKKNWTWTRHKNSQTENRKVKVYTSFIDECTCIKQVQAFYVYFYDVNLWNLTAPYWRKTWKYSVLRIVHHWGKAIFGLF